ncbi:MAG: gliding motility protein GldL [Bacteroidales bacterium]
MKFARKKAWKTFMSRLYGWGASLVIIGALFKIMHWPGADYALVIGMGVEAVVFFFSAFEHVYEEPDWSLVYPELAGLESEVPDEKRQLRGGGAATQQNITLSTNLDKLLEEADIGPELINNLGRGLRNLSDNAARLADLSNASVATNKYIENMETASKSVLELSQSYKSKSEYLKQDLSLSQEYNETMKTAIGSLNDMSVAHRQSAGYIKDNADAAENLTKNLSVLNTAYELQQQAANNQTEASQKYQESINDVVNTLHNSAESAKVYKEEMDKLTKNIKDLNSVYGNMLSAMNFNVNR